MNPFLGQQQQQQPQLQPQQQQQQQQQQQSQQSSLFGSNALFGGNKSTFGSTVQPSSNLNASALTPSSNILTSRSGAGGQQQSADPQAQFTKLVQSIEGIYNAWNPASKDCRFQVSFPPPQSSFYMPADHLSNC
jgi:nuclear pore complex protein Nup54